LSDPVVHVSELTKIFKVPERDPGLRAAAKSLIRRKTRDVHAVEAISFDIEPGEVVGFLGPNGAGKTTTLKMLAGLLYPTSGEARVLGHVPSRREKDYLRRMTMVMGNRNQLQWDIPALDSFELYRAIYRLRREDYLAMRDELIELLDVGDLVRKPVRNLSLGERMKVEIVGSLLHRPQVLFLDEPTVGLDPTARRLVWERLEILREEAGTTLVVTTHQMDEAERQCQRIAIMDLGDVVAQGSPDELCAEFDVPSLEDVFTAATGHGIGEGGNLRDVRASRRLSSRLG
jgi:ABC-2 type transport system ATP-binding protein